VSIVERLDRYQRAHPRVSVPIAVVYKFVDDQGNYLTALMTYYAFLAVLPLLLLSTTILGFVLSSHPHLLHEILDSAVGQFPVVGNQLADPRGVTGSGLGLGVGIVGTIYGSLGFAQAIQNAMNVIWRVPRNRRPNPILSRLRSLVLLGTIALAGAGTTALTIIGTNLNGLPILATLGIEVGTLVVNTALFTVAFRFATAKDVTVRQTLPGAVGASFIWLFLQLGATAYVQHVVQAATATNGVFALVLGLVAWLYLQSLVVVLAVEYNTVRSGKFYPRALMTIFTDDVDLTDADHRVYAEQIEAQRSKGFQIIEVSYDADRDGVPDDGFVRRTERPQPVDPEN
jgi:YihY family inner membrane protein